MSKDLIGYFSCDPETGAPVWDEGCVCGDNIFSVEGTGTVGRPIKFADTSVSAEPVAYLDLGAGGYMDVGTDLTDEQLAALPKGRHMLAIVGTYGVEGFTAAPVAAQAQQVEPTCYVRPAATIATLNGYTVCPKGEGIPVYAHPPTQAQPKPRKVERTSDFSVELRFGSCREASEFERRFQQVDGSPETQGKPVDELTNLQGQQQPVSGADGLSEQTKWPVLKAMANNYIPGKHTWDHLDADACSKGAEEIRQLRAALAQQDEPKLDKPAKVGGARFGAGIKWSTVIAAAQRLYAYEVTPEKEAERIAGADQKMQALWHHHIAAQAQQDADKVDAERWRTFIDNYDEYGTVGFIDGSALKAVIDAARKEQA